MRVHRLVYQGFKGNIPEGHDIDHINGDQLDNHLDNLRAISHDEHSALTTKRIRQKVWDEAYSEGYTAGWKASLKAIL